MPHVIVKLWPGKSDEQKRRLSAIIERGVMDTLGYGEEAVSVGFEEVASGDWTRQVYDPDILGRWDTLTKQPGYGARPKGRHAPLGHTARWASRDCKGKNHDS